MFRYSASVLIASISLMIVGCAPSKGTENSPGSTLRVGMVPKLETIPYFKACHKGAEEAAKELGIDLYYRGPSDNRVEDQIKIVEDMIQNGLDVITIAPNDPEAIAPILKKAEEQGIVVVTWDADANAESSGRDAFCNQTPTDELAKTMVDIVAEGMNGEGKAVIVSTTPSAPNQNAWMGVMLPYLKEKYPKVELLETLYPAEDVSKARQMTADTIAAHPDLKGVWGLSSVALPGAAEAVRQAKKADQITVTGVTLPSELRDYVLDGTVKRFCLWNPEDLGYLSVYVAKEIKEKEFTEGTRDFGRVKQVRVQGTEVILGPPIIFDKTNIDRYSF